MHVLHILLMSLIMVSVEVEGKTIIELYPYDEVVSQSNCTHGLLTEYDKIVMRGFLEFDTQWNWNSTIQILSLEINASNSFNFATLDEFPFVHCLEKSNQYMTCEENGQKNAFDIRLHLRAAERLSLAKLKIVLSSGNKTYESQEQQLPFIYDSSKDFMYVNDQLLDPKRCIFDLSQTKQPLQLCCSKATPDLTMAYIERNGIKVQGNNRCAKYEEKFPAELPEYSFKCEVCSSYVYTVKCFTNFYQIHKNTEIVEKNDPGALESVMAPFVFVTFMLVVWITFKKKIRSLWKKDIPTVSKYRKVNTDDPPQMCHETVASESHEGDFDTGSVNESRIEESKDENDISLNEV